jgi:hypothetical protein
VAVTSLLLVRAGGMTGPLGATAPLSEELSVSVPLPEFSASIASVTGSSRQQLSPRPSLGHSTSFGVSAALSMASDLLVDDLVRAVVRSRYRCDCSFSFAVVS